MIIGTTQWVIIGGVIGAFVVSTIAQNLVQKNALMLDRDLRERIWKREAESANWWRLLESAGIVAMFAGLARMMGLFRSPLNWVIPTMAIGFTVVCLATSLRTWLSRKAYAIEAPGTPASRSAFNAAVWVTITEVSLGCIVCWFVFSSLSNTSRTNTSAPTTPTVNSPVMPRESADMLWIDESEALRLLKGKDAAYLKSLVAGDYIRARDEGGKSEYRRDDISATKLAGLPTPEDIQEAIARAKAKSEPPPVPEKPKEGAKPKTPTEKIQE